MSCLKILDNIQNKDGKFKTITDEEIRIISLIIKGENEYISESDWNDILYEAEKSPLIQEVLCLEDYYDSRNANALSKYLNEELFPLFMKKENIRNATAENICDRIQPSVLKDIIENHPENISEPFRKIIRSFDFEKAKEIDFAHYGVFDGLDVNAEYMVSKHSTNEKIMTAISNNPNIREDIRNAAFNNMHDPLSITNYTNYMKISMYHNAAERIFDYPQKTIEDSRQISEATDILLHMLENKQMPLSCEYDLLQRLQSMPSLGVNRRLTNSLLLNTNDAIILKKAYEYNPTMTKGIVRKNPCCDIFTLEEFINESIEKIKELTKRGETSIDILKEKNFICSKLEKQPLSLKSYKLLHKYAKQHDQLLDCMILANPFIRTNSVKDLFKSNKTDLVKFRELLEQDFAKHGMSNNEYLKYLDFAIYLQFKNNEEYFQQHDSLSIKTFADRFGNPLQNISTKEKEIISEICDKLREKGEIEWVKELDNTVKMVYNIENEFGPNQMLYSYTNGSIQFDNISLFPTLSYKAQEEFKTMLLKKEDLSILEKVQNAIEAHVMENGMSAQTCMFMCRISDFYDVITDKIEEIEKVIEDRNIGIDL